MWEIRTVVVRKLNGASPPDLFLGNAILPPKPRAGTDQARVIRLQAHGRQKLNPPLLLDLIIRNGGAHDFVDHKTAWIDVIPTMVIPEMMHPVQPRHMTLQRPFFHIGVGCHVEPFIEQERRDAADKRKCSRANQRAGYPDQAQHAIGQHHMDQRHRHREPDRYKEQRLFVGEIMVAVMNAVQHIKPKLVLWGGPMEQKAVDAVFIQHLRQHTNRGQPQQMRIPCRYHHHPAQQPQRQQHLQGQVREHKFEAIRIHIRIGGVFVVGDQVIRGVNIAALPDP